MRLESSKRPRRRDSEEGVILVLFSLTLLIILGVIALSVDIGDTLRLNTEAQAAFDAAALRGGQALFAGRSQAEADLIARAITDANLKASGLTDSQQTEVRNSLQVSFQNSRVVVGGNVTHNSWFAQVLSPAYNQLTTAAQSVVRYTPPQAVSQPVNIVLVLDNSSSMNVNTRFRGRRMTKLQALQEAARSFVTQLPDQHRLSIIDYDRDIRDLLYDPDNDVPFHDLTDESRDFIDQRLANIRWAKPYSQYSGTNIPEAMMNAYDFLGAAPPGKSVVVFMTDGLPTKNWGTVRPDADPYRRYQCARSSYTQNSEEYATGNSILWADRIRDVNPDEDGLAGRNTPIYTVGFGSNDPTLADRVDPDYLKRLAGTGGIANQNYLRCPDDIPRLGPQSDPPGQYFPAEQADDLDRAFSDIIDQIQIVAEEPRFVP